LTTALYEEVNNKEYILQLQDVPIDIHNSKHLEAQQLAGKQLGLL
jgi:hypothetical protein